MCFLYEATKLSKMAKQLNFSSIDQINLPSLGKVNQSRDGRFVSKVDQIGPKWDESGAFSDQMSVHLAWGRNLGSI